MGLRVWGLKGAALVAAAAAVLCLAVVAVSSHASAAAQAGLLKVRLGGDSAQTRIVIDLGRATSGKLMADGAADGRAVLVLSDVTADVGLQGPGHGLVKTWAIDQTGGGARLQMDLAAEARVTRRFLLPPADGIDHYRYVVDVAATTGAVALAKTTSRPAAPLTLVRMPPLPLKPPLSLKKVIVIDAGHGGHDPGAHGQQVCEKDLNLAAARALKTRLERSGRYKVVMTRETDVYVPLETRVRIAQHADADLFISLHSDSGPEAGLRGASVYTLSDKASLRAARFVRKDDWFMKASLMGGGVSDILFDLTQRATKNRSAAFAQTLVGHIEGKAPLLRRSHRDAGFMVLLAPNVPAVLLEMGFLSNTEDEQLLRDADRRGRLMTAVGDAIDDYFAENVRLAAR